MKLAFLISMALILPVFAAYFIVEATEKLPLQITLNEELSLNEEVNKKLTHPTQPHEVRKYCSSSKEGFMKPMSCNV